LHRGFSCRSRIFSWPAPPPPSFALRATDGPPPPLSWGRISETVLAAPLCARVLQNQSREARNRGGREYRGVAPRCFSVRYARFADFKTNKEKGSGTPTNAGPQPPHHRMRRRSIGSGSSVGVPPRLSPKGVVVPRLNSGQASWDAAGALDPVSPRQPGRGDLAQFKRPLQPPHACPSPGMHLPRRS
jgi:hypothetical protein